MEEEKPQMRRMEMVEPIADTIMTFVTSYLSDAAPMIMLFLSEQNVEALVAGAF